MTLGTTYLRGDTLEANGTLVPLQITPKLRKNELMIPWYTHIRPGIALSHLLAQQAPRAYDR